MGKIKIYFFNSKLRIKIILTFCILLAVNMILSSISFYFYANRSTSKKFQQNSQDILRQVNLHLEEKFTGLTQKVNAISSNLSFLNPMNEFLQNDQVTMDPILAGDIANKIFEIKNSDDFVDSMYICTSKYIFDDYLMIRKRGTVFEDTVMYRYFVYKPWETVAWFPSMENPLYESKSPIIPVVYRQKIRGENIYYVINLSKEALAEYLDGAYDAFETMFIVDENGTDVLGNEAELEKAVLKKADLDQVKEQQEWYGEVTAEGENYYAAAALMNVNQWRIYALSTTSSMMQDLKHIRWFLFLVSCLTSAGCLVIILWISDLLTQSLMELAGEMEKAGAGDYDVRFSYPYEDEAGRLGNSFNRMLDTIQDNIRELENEKEQVREVQKQKRKAELQALQAQINPHFLYNTLNMITWQAVSQGAEEISLISNALGKYFRISLSRGRECITLREEAGHVRSYLEIQKIRYKAKLNYDIRIPEEMEYFHTIKLILQPLVENALYHGIKVKEGKGNVWVYGEVVGQNMVLTVEDDGEGIPEEKMALLNSKLQNGEVDSETGYGIYNVNNRIRLYYGEEYGLRLKKGICSGIKAVLTLPIRQMKGMVEDV